VGHPQALGQQQVELVAQALAPMAEVGALVREAVLEERLAGEVVRSKNRNGRETSELAGVG